MKKITFFAFLAICISALFAFNATAKTQLTYANFFPPQHGQSKLAESWCKEVEKRTNGEVSFKYYPSSTLLNPGTMYDGVVNGIADVGFTVLAYSRGRFTVGAGIDLPLGYTSGVQATKIANAVFNKFQPKEFKDTKIMYLHAHGPGVLHTSDKKVANLGDLKGLKVRGTGTSGLIVGALGGSAVGKSMRESYTMLQKGVVDGSLHPLEANKGWKLGEVVHYAVKTGATSYTTTFAVFMGKNVWSKLTPAQQKIIKEIKKSQKELNKEFLNPETSILDSLDQITFKGLEFYRIDTKFHIEAKFVRTPNEEPFLMKTSTDRLPEYVKYGEAHFTLDKKELVLNIYQNTKYSKIEEYKDDLFLPYTDLTSGDGSYGGGKYLDLKIPKGSTIIIDFNKTYNPYCAYSHRYSCPVPPEENDVLVRIEAGVKEYGKH